MSFPPPSKDQARLIWFSASALAVAVLFGLVGAIIWGLAFVLSKLSAVLMPIAIGMVLAYILDPVVEYFVRKGLPRLRAIVVVFILGMLVVGGLLGSVIPGLVEETRKLVDDLPRLAQRFEGRMRHFLRETRVGSELSSVLHLSPQWTSEPKAVTNSTAEAGASRVTLSPATNVELNVNIHLNNGTNQPSSATNSVDIISGMQPLRKALDGKEGDNLLPGMVTALIAITKWFGGQLGNVTTWAEFLIGFVLVPVYLFYFLLEKQKITVRWTDYLPLTESRVKEEVVFVLKAINDCLIVFFRGQVLVALCVGVMLTIGYSILGLNYAVLLGAVAAVLGIVPYLGTVISLALALTTAGLQFGDWTHPLIVLAIAACVKLLEDFVIGPKIIGDRSGLHPLTIIIAVMVGTTVLGGVLGALLAIPLTAVLRTLMFRYIWKERPGHRHKKEHSEASVEP